MAKKKLALLLTFALVAALFAGCGGKGDSKIIKIGVVLPLSGQVAAFGTSGRNGIQMLEAETNKNGGVLGKQVKFVFQDDEGKPATAATVGTKLISEDKVVAIIGPLTSGCANSLGPIAVSNKIPMITGTATNPTVTVGKDYVFRTCFIDPFQGTVISKFAAEDLKAKTAAILYDNGIDYSKGLAEFFKKGFEAAGGKVVAMETYNTGDQDFNAQLTKIKPTKPDVILLPDYYSTVGIEAKQARALGITVPLLGGDGWDSADLFKVGGTAVNNSYLSDHYSAQDTSPKVVAFQKDYKDKYKVDADAMAVLNYDAAKILLEAIKSAGKTDSESIKTALLKTDIQVVSGHVTFDANRDAIKSAVMLKVEGGKFNFAKKVNP